MYVESLGIYVNNVEDLRDKISEDMYELIEHLIATENDSLEEDYCNLKDELEVYEYELESFRSSFNEILSLVNKLNKELGELYDYVSNTKRINREKIFNSIKKVKLESIQDIIDNL